MNLYHVDYGEWLVKIQSFGKIYNSVLGGFDKNVSKLIKVKQCFRNSLYINLKRISFFAEILFTQKGRTGKLQGQIGW